MHHILSPGTFFLIFFFLFHSSNMLTDTIVPWHQWWPPAHSHTITTPILHPSDMATWRRAGGGLRHNASWAPCMFSFLYITTYYIFSMEWAYEWPEQDGNGWGSRHNTSQAPGMFFCITFNCFFKTTNPFFTDWASKQVWQGRMRWKWNWVGTRDTKRLKPQVRFYILSSFYYYTN